MDSANRASAKSLYGRDLFWGDLHNHNAVGYALGSLERSIELAREHLDFFAFTGHASWHDMPIMPGDRHMKWVKGFETHTDHWPKTLELMREANRDDFVAIVGYEWHSSHFGDYCILFSDEKPELFLPDHVNTLLDFAEARNALAIPHHVAYKQGWRGANWEYYREHPSPVVEIFSEHGCTETDRAPFPMIRHSNGGSSTSNTVQPQLRAGARFGFIASTDDHLGYPGAWGEGLTGIWADDLSSGGIFEALRTRRTYAVTGDRIVLDVTLNDLPMGSEMPFTAERQIDVTCEGQDSLQMLELVKNGKTIARHFPEDDADETVTLPGKAKCRIQYGWGPWAALNLERNCSWDMRITIEGGKFIRALGCFGPVPFDEKGRDKVRVISESEIHLVSQTARKDALNEDPTKSVVLELEASRDAVLTVHLNEPCKQTVHSRLSDLLTNNVVEFTGVFTSESYIIGRLLGPSDYSAKVRWEDSVSEPSGSDWYYVRATQHNGQMAWSSPIWVG